MLNLLAIFIGGGLGSIARFGISKLVTHNFHHINPIATLVSNTLSTIVLGVIIYFASEKIEMPFALRLMIIVGFCGGFSTFSTFSYETFELLRLGNYIFAFANIFVSLLLGIGVLFILSKSL